MATKKNGKKTDPQALRRNPRYKPGGKLRAKYSSAGQDVEGDVRTISKSGFFLNILDGGAAESEGDVLLTLPSQGVSIRGTIRSVLPGKGFGIEFLNLSLSDEETLAAYCDTLRLEGKGKKNT